MQSAAVAVAVETARTWTEQMAAAAAEVVARLDKPEDLVHPVKDPTAVMLARTHIRTAALVAVAQVLRVRSAMPERETVALVLPTLVRCTRAAVAVEVVALVLEVVAQAAAVLVVTASEGLEPQDLQTRVVAVAARVRQIQT